MKNIFKIKIFFLTALLFAAISCKDLSTVNNNNPDRNAVLASGTDLLAVLGGGYISYWQAVHDVHPAMALSITSDTYGVSWGNFAGRRMGEEPRASYNNRSSETQDYKKLVEDPWFGLLSAVSTANDILIALRGGTSIDNGGPQDKTVEASALFLRGVSWGYLGLIFDQALLVDENTSLDEQIPFTPYQDMIGPAVRDLDQAASTATSAGADFTNNFFNGITLDSDQFTKLCNSYSARFLSNWPRTESEAGGIDWNSVLSHAQNGLDFDFSPIADGNLWISYQRFAFAETGQGAFWARLDQRLVATFDPSQPTRYPEVVALGEPELTDSMATSDDARLLSDYLYVPNNNFAIDRGEWHFSNYKNNRNAVDPTFAGDGSSVGPMPAFLAADNDLLKAEAFLETGKKADAIAIINAGTRVTRGNLPPIDGGASDGEVRQAIRYERAIELNSASPLNLWTERRRWGPRQNFREVTALGGLQIGTPAQLPVPADELGVQELAPYNFGGSQDPEGINRF